MDQLELSIRKAEPDELARAIAIDEAAGALFVNIGIDFTLADEHPFIVEEHARWRACLQTESLFFAQIAGQPVGFYALNDCDGYAHLEQLAVLPEHGRRGIGAQLVAHAFAVARRRGATQIWLTTYAHVPWNGPFYERRGFGVVPGHECGAQLRVLLDAQRTVLPNPEQRIAMRALL